MAAYDPREGMPQSMREIEELREALAGEQKKWGNSQLFKDINRAFAEYTEALKEAPEADGTKYSQAYDNLRSACQTYLDKREGARFSRGQRRLDMVTRITSSMSFWSAERAEDAFNREAKKPLDRGQAMRLVNAGDRLKEACETHLESGAMRYQAETEAVKKRMAERTVGLDTLRDISNVSAYAGRSWDDIGRIETEKAQIADGAGKTGANVSERYLSDYKGKRGFFTAENRMSLNRKEYVDRLIAEEKTANPSRAGLLDRQQYLIKELVGEEGGWSKAVLENPDAARNRNVANHVLKYWDGLPDGAEKEALIPLVKSGMKLEAMAGGIRRMMNPSGAQKPLSFEESFGKALDTALKDDEAAKKTIMGSAEKMRGLLTDPESPKPGVIRNQKTENYLLSLKASLYNIRSADQRAKDITELLKDGQAVHRITDAAVKAEAANLAIGAGNLAKMDESGTQELTKGGNELTLRSVGMTRIADLLGIGNIIARSEKASMEIGGKTVDGCFMEFAEGIDMQSKDPHTMELIRTIDFKENAGFNRDSHNLEVLDYLCAQNDRHQHNMFYKLSEPDADGKRNVIGLQGIDNDLAFGTTKDLFSGHQGKLEDMAFIDKDLAEKVRGLDRKSLEYALGDIISAEQMDAMEVRLTALQDYMKKDMMVELRADEWDLNKYSISEYKGKLPTNREGLQAAYQSLLDQGMDREKANYLKGLIGIEASKEYNITGSNRIHKGGAVRAAQDIFEKNQGKALDEQADLMQDVGRLMGVRDRVTFKDMKEMERPRERKANFLGEKKNEKQGEKGRVR